jgi:hypothetical protein
MPGNISIYLQSCSQQDFFFALWPNAGICIPRFTVHESPGGKDILSHWHIFLFKHTSQAFFNKKTSCRIPKNRFNKKANHTKWVQWWFPWDLILWFYRGFLGHYLPTLVFKRPPLPVFSYTERKTLPKAENVLVIIENLLNLKPCILNPISVSRQYANSQLHEIRQ